MIRRLIRYSIRGYAALYVVRGVLEDIETYRDERKSREQDTLRRSGLVKHGLYGNQPSRLHLAAWNVVDNASLVFNGQAYLIPKQHYEELRREFF